MILTRTIYAHNQHVLRDIGSDVFIGITVVIICRTFTSVRYQGEEASIAIEDGTILDGTFPVKQLKLVHAWIEIHKDELMVDWDLAVNGEEPFRISPLQ